MTMLASEVGRGGYVTSYPEEDNLFVDRQGNEYQYDEFIGKWLKKGKKKLAANPRVIAIRKKLDSRRVAKGKAPRHPELSQPKPKQKEIKVTALETNADAGKTKAATDIEPLTKSEAQAHKNINKAIQEELKTKQEELKTLGLEKKVSQEDLKADNQKAKNELAGAGKGLIWVVAIVGGLVVLKKMFGTSSPSGGGAAQAG